MKHSEKYFNSKIKDSASLITEYIPLSEVKRYGDYRRSEGMMALWELQKNEKAVASVMETLELMAKEDNI